MAPDKAYFFDGTGLQLVVYPQAMDLTGQVIDLADVLADATPEGWTPRVFLNSGPVSHASSANDCTSRSVPRL